MSNKCLCLCYVYEITIYTEIITRLRADYDMGKNWAVLVTRLGNLLDYLFLNLLCTPPPSFFHFLFIARLLGEIDRLASRLRKVYEAASVSPLAGNF